jgi:putative salt-induced outer membrane protein YdiY
LGAVVRYALNKEIRFSEEAEFLPNLVGESRFLVNSTTKLNARLTAALSISVAFLLNFDSSPGGGKKSTDTALTLGLEAAF